MKKDLITSFAWGGGIVVLALAASLARKLGYIDQDMTTRIILGATGLMIAAFGNRIPKTFVAQESAKKAQRVAAWSLVITGLIYAGAFAFVPLQYAIVIGCSAVLLGILVTFGYCFSLRIRTGVA